MEEQITLIRLLFSKILKLKDSPRAYQALKLLTSQMLQLLREMQGKGESPEENRQIAFAYTSLSYTSVKEVDQLHDLELNSSPEYPHALERAIKLIRINILPLLLPWIENKLN